MRGGEEEGALEMGLRGISPKWGKGVDTVAMSRDALKERWRDPPWSMFDCDSQASNVGGVIHVSIDQIGGCHSVDDVR